MSSGYSLGNRAHDKRGNNVQQERNHQPAQRQVRQAPIPTVQVSTDSKHLVGVMLARDTPCKINHPVFDRFSSIRNYWEWLVADVKDDRLRTMPVRALASHFRKQQAGNDNTHRGRVLGFRVLLAEAYWERVRSSKELKKLMLETEGYKLCNYNVNAAGLRTYPSWGELVDDILFEIRKVLIAQAAGDTHLFFDPLGILHPLEEKFILTNYPVNPDGSLLTPDTITMTHVYRMVLEEAGIELEPMEATGLTPATAVTAIEEAPQNEANEAGDELPMQPEHPVEGEPDAVEVVTEGQPTQVVAE